MGEYAYDVIDDIINWEGTSFKPARRSTTRTCKYCGQGGLFWHQMSDRTWRLISYSNDTEMRPLLHSCRTHSEPEELDE